MAYGDLPLETRTTESGTKYQTKVAPQKNDKTETPRVENKATAAPGPVTSTTAEGNVKGK